MSLPPSFSGMTNPLPLRVHQRVPTTRFISSGMPNLLFFSLTSEPLSHHLPEELFDRLFAGIPGVDHAFQVGRSKGDAPAFLNALRRSCLLKPGERDSFFIGF